MRPLSAGPPAVRVDDSVEAPRGLPCRRPAVRRTGLPVQEGLGAHAARDYTVVYQVSAGWRELGRWSSLTTSKCAPQRQGTGDH